MPNLRKPVLMDPRRILPLKEAELGSPCDCCKQPVAKWSVLFTSAGWVPVCALCWLYESVWAKNRREELSLLLDDVAESRGTPIDRDETGKLRSLDEADRILATIVITSRVFMDAETGKKESWQ